MRDHCYFEGNASRRGASRRGDGGERLVDGARTWQCCEEAAERAERAVRVTPWRAARARGSFVRRSSNRRKRVDEGGVGRSVRQRLERNSGTLTRECEERCSLG